MSEPDPPTPECPGDDELEALVAQDEQAVRAWSAHVAGCARCQATLDAIRDNNAFITSLASGLGYESKRCARRGSDTPRAIGRFIVERELGRGGMGVVYLAHDPTLCRAVALKVLPAESLGDEAARRRLEREAQVLASLNDPNIATVHSLERSEDGSMVLVLEYVAGESLDDRLRRGAMEGREALDVCRQVARALEVAHHRGVVHRDLKPANIRRTTEGVVKVLDFGLAQLSATSVLADSATRMGGLAGTPGYMSPEQALGRPEDERTDAFAFGCVMYECLTGRRAFRGRSFEEAIRATLEEDVDWRALPAGLGAEVARVLRRCLEKDVGRRVRDMGDVRVVLEDELAAASSRGWSTVAQGGEAGSNLPAEVTSFVGREAAIAELVELVGREHHLTLTGSGGCGKTRLALRVAATAKPNFCDGVWLVDLAPIADEAQVVRAIAGTLGVRERPGEELLETLTGWMRERRMLLVLDNCEHVLGSCRVAAAALVRQCPGVTLLATSRERFGIEGELTWRVPPMEVPKAGEPLSAEDRSAQPEAVRLFMARARAVGGMVGEDEGALRAAGDVCRRLDGIPLAIELAAARTRVLGVEQVRDRLDDAFGLLKGGSRTALPRHQTLRATIDWSYEQLSRAEAWVLRRMSVFAGGWTLEGAAAVCAPERGEVETLDVLEALVDKSLVVVESATGAMPRYRLLETVRAYGRERLRANGEEVEAREAHLDYMLSLAQRAERELRGPDQAAWTVRLTTEHGNLLAAVEWCDSARDGWVRGLRLVGSLWTYWEPRDQSLGRSLITRALGRPGAEAPSAERAKALSGCGSLAKRQGDYKVARQMHEEALRIRESLGDEFAIAASRGNVALALMELGDFGGARARFGECLEYFQRAGDRAMVARVLGNMGLVARYEGALAEARRLQSEALDMRRAIGDRRGISISLLNLAIAEILSGDHGPARPHVLEALAIARELDDRVSGAEALERAADLLKFDGQLEEAARFIGAAISVRRAIGSALTPPESAQQSRLIDSIRATIGEAADRALAEGSRWGFGRASTRALEVLADPGRGVATTATP